MEDRAWNVCRSFLVIGVTGRRSTGLWTFGRRERERERERQIPTTALAKGRNEREREMLDQERPLRLRHYGCLRGPHAIEQGGEVPPENR